MDPKYKYVLLSNDTGERRELIDAPIGWDATKFRLVRDLTYLGILKSISVEFEFVGDGFEFLQTQRLRFGVDADVIIRVYKRNPNEFLYEGKINFENYVEDRKYRKFKVDIIQSGFIQKFNNREDVKLNILNNISLDRAPVDPVGVKNALIRGKSIQFFSSFDGSSLSGEQPFTIYHHTIPFFVAENGSTNVFTDFYGENLDGWTPPATENELVNAENAVYINFLPEPQTPHFQGNATVTLVFRSTTTTFTVYNKIRFLLVNEDNTIASTLFETDLNLITTQNASISYPLSWDFTPTVAPNQYVVMLCEKYFITGDTHEPLPLDTFRMETIAPGAFKNETYWPTLVLTITDDSVITDTTHPVILPHELFTNLVSQINGGTFYSEFFGRLDLGYDADGDGAFLAITKGELLRGIPLADVQIAFSLRDAFQSYSAVFCLGATIQDDLVRIEPLDNLFNANISTTIGEVNELTVQPTKEFLFNSVKCGFPKNEYLEENGRDEFNTQYQYTNALKASKKELDLVSKFYGDGYGIEFARRESVITTGTRDSKYDDQIFFIDLIKIPDDEDPTIYTLQSRRNEGILFVDGIFSPETALNLNIAAGQNMLRWRKYLNIPLHKKPKVYYFQTKDKNASLELVTPLGTTTDGDDLDMGSAAYFLPDDHQFKCAISIDQLFAILQNPLGIVSFTYQGEKFFDFVFEIDAETDKGMAQWRMLGTKETPVEIEDDVEENQNVLKYGDGLTDFVKYGNGEKDVLLYQ